MKTYGAELVIEDVSADEPPEESFLTQSFDYSSFEIITDEEVARLTSPLLSSMSSAASGTSLSSNSSLGSAGNGPTFRGSGRSPSSFPLQHRNLPNKNTTPVDSTNTYPSQSSSSSKGRNIVLAEEELTASTKIWYNIQLKGHNYYEDYASANTTNNKLGTMEDSSTKRTNWLLNLLHLHERMRQAAADKQRFNINDIPQKTREQLKHIYVY